MKIKNLLLFAAAASLGLSAFAQEVTNGEYVEFKNGTPTQDHFFVRGTYDDMGTPETQDNVVSFKGGTPQVVWIYLNDDEIYQNEDIQNLAPQDYKPGTPYNEITYNSFQFDVYTFTCFNSNAYGTHFSAKNPNMYAANGALKKDAKLFGITVQNKNQDQVEGRINGDMIIGNTLLTLRETPEIFFYGTGGRDLAQKTVNNVKYFNVAGMESNVPFEGVNIMVTTYNDGTTSTCKVIK